MPKSKSELGGTASRLADVVKISRQFLRSVRIDTDVGREDALSGYVCQGTARSLLENMAKQVRDTRQRAFTWTGPYGGGKSSLALLLCSLVGGSQSLRARARAILDAEDDSPILSAFDAHDSGWMVVPLVGKRARVSEELGKALAALSDKPSRARKFKDHQDVIGELVAVAEQHPQGVLVLIDELGKYLESAAQEGDDVYFFQELAEAASRAAGKLVVVGILHQSFDAYAARLGRQARDDWAKVQGRYVDIPLVAATDEVVELVGRAIEVNSDVDREKAKPIAHAIAAAIRTRRPGTPANIGAAIARCWPLHPVVASLLGPISRRRFSQNERSTFGFLASREPLGFMEFLDGGAVNWSSMYAPSRYWDYLRVNIEQAILASPDGHRWAVASEAVERTEAKGTQLHIELTKCVALIEMFRGGSGLVPELEVLELCVQGFGPTQIADALRDLVAWKILIERKHLGAYGVFAGSDFDIEGAINQARGDIGVPNLQQLSAFTDLQPILAKRLYHDTGTMRWFTRRIVRLEDVGPEGLTSKGDKGSVGAFLLCLPEIGLTTAAARTQAMNLSREEYAKDLVIGIPSNAERIAELALEVLACERVFASRPEIDGDAVARKELLGRTTAVRTELEDELSDAFVVSAWYWRGAKQEDNGSGFISRLASKVAEQTFPKAPRLHSELVNRDSLSSTSNRARKDLMYRMVSHAGFADLGYSGYPADAGLYFTIIKATGLHREQKNGLWGYGDPFTHGTHEPMFWLWRDTSDFLLKAGDRRKLTDLYEWWSMPPYGLRSGILPILAMAFFLAHRSALALYIDGVFTPELSEAAIDEWLLDPSRVALTYVSASSDQAAYIRAVAASLPANTMSTETSGALDVARSLVSLVLSLPNWTRRTTTVSLLAQSVRAMLLKANDPHKVLFADLPTLLNAASAEEVLSKLKGITSELVAAYPSVLNQVKAAMLSAVDQSDGDLQRLRSRAQTIKGIVGEFRLEAFVARLETFSGSDEAIEGLISLASSKPPAQWVDRDIDSALLHLGSWAHDFRRAEALASLRGRPSTRRAMAVVFGGARGHEITASIDIDDSESAAVSKLAGGLLVHLQQQKHEVALAALAEAGALLLKATNQEIAT